MYPHGSRSNQRYRGPLETAKINTGMVDTQVNINMVNTALAASEESLKQINTQLNRDEFYEVYQDSEVIKVQNDITKGVID